MKTKLLFPIAIFSVFAAVGCSQPTASESTASEEPPTSQKENSDAKLDFAAENGSIALPEGFRAVVVADKLGGARHITLRENGDMYVNLASPLQGKGLMALRDEDGDGVADQKELFGKGGGTGIKVQGNYLYYTTTTQVFRKKFNGDELVPSGEEELIATLPDQSQHAAKSIALDADGHLYVNVGAPSNSCQKNDRATGSPGQDPCPLLKNHGGIWRFSASQKNQKQSDGTRYATGIRNAVGITWNSKNNTLYAMQHGRDQLHAHWGGLYSEEENAELPAEEMLEVQQGDDFGWPYCYYDHQKNKKLLNPEYGGNKDKVGRCEGKEDPVIAFPGHWAPNAIEFYHQSSFPEKYRNGAFVAFHGSWNRAPLPQQGYKVVFVPFANGKPTGEYEDFATEFANEGGPVTSGAEYRPCGLAIGPDGSLYVSDDSRGRIWRIVYTK